MAKIFADIAPTIKGSIENFIDEVLKRQGDNIIRIVLFGSVARGDDNDDSDIDIFILMKEYSLMGKANDDLIESSIFADEKSDYKTYTAPFALSLASYADGERIGVSVIKNIKKEGIVLYDDNLIIP